MKKKFKLTDLDCANCAAKMEKRINELPGVAEATITYFSCLFPSAGRFAALRQSAYLSALK